MYDHGRTIVRGLTLVEALDTRRNEVWHAATTGDGEERAGRRVAVKLLHPAYEPVFPQRFGRRARTLARIVRHGTNWLPLLDHGYTTDGRRYVVSPLHRSSLADQLEHGPTPWYPATRLIVGAAETVAQAHDNGYSLGYLRPSGILIDGPADVRVVVYGMSTRRFDDGTAQFMAPELAGDANPIPPSDVFSLVLILASLVAGRPIDRGEPPPEVIDELSGAAPARILEIIDYGLSANLLNRYADAGRLAGALRAALQEPSRSGPRRRSAPPKDAVDPLRAILAEPLVAVHHETADGSAVDAGGMSAPDRRAVRHPDETPTAVPFDPPIIGIDDPTDPGIAAPGELDIQTDHVGVLAHLISLPKSWRRPSSGPLADLLTTVGPDAGPDSRDQPGGDETGPWSNIEPPVDRLDDTAPVPGGGGAGNGGIVDRSRRRDGVDPRPLLGSIIDIDDQPWASADLALSREPSSMTETSSLVEPSRAAVMARNLGRFVAVHRRRIIWSVAIVGVLAAIGAIGPTELLGRDATDTDRTPVSASIVSEQVIIDRSSPSAGRAPGVPTTRPGRQTTGTLVVSTTIGDQATPSTTR